MNYHETSDITSKSANLDFAIEKGASVGVQDTEEDCVGGAIQTGN